MSFWRGKRVAITGAGGTVGRHLAERLKAEAAALLLIDNSEIAVWRLMQRYEGWPAYCCFADIRDRARLKELFLTFEPDLILHAAALKHVPICEANPDEAERTNVQGTKNVCAAAWQFNPRVVWGKWAKVIVISTDKAADPTGVMGRTKLIAERLVIRYGAAVRFHNVFGSAGSVVELWAQQIAKGGPVTVTHPDMVRWFSAPQDACDLLLKCVEHAMGPDGRRLYALEVGKPMRIMDLAESMIGDRWDIKIEIIGMRPGERLEEKLIANNERRIDVGIEGIFAIERAEVSRSAGGGAGRPQGTAEGQASKSEAARA